jgi:hypothetical protein
LFFEIEYLENDRPAAVSDKTPNQRAAPTGPSRQRARKSRKKIGRAKEEGTRSRAPKGSLLDERAYWKPILEILASSDGGRAPAREVVDRVGEVVDERLTPLDREQVSSGGLRWHTRVMFARLRLKDAGLLKRDSPRGVWEISDAGRQALAEGRVESAA